MMWDVKRREVFQDHGQLSCCFKIEDNDDEIVTKFRNLRELSKHTSL